MNPHFYREKKADGFTLVMTLSILAAVTILVVGLFGLVSRERQISATFDSLELAEQALQAGLAKATRMMLPPLENESTVVMSVPWLPAGQSGSQNRDEQGRARNLLFTATYQPATGAWSYRPLCSGVTPVLERMAFERPINAGTLGFQAQPLEPHSETDQAALERLPRSAPWLAAPARFWETMPELPGEDSQSTLTSRFCFAIEDLQGLLPLWNVGHADPLTQMPTRSWTHAWWPQAPPEDGVPPVLQEETLQSVVVPGLNLRTRLRNPEDVLLNNQHLATPPIAFQRLNPSSLWTLINPVMEPLFGEPLVPARDIQIHNLLLNARSVNFVPEMWREVLLRGNLQIGNPGLRTSQLSDRIRGGSLEGSLEGSLVDLQLRQLEENLIGRCKPYYQMALIPPDVSIFPAVWNTPKLNLNDLIQRIEEAPPEQRTQRARQAVDQIAAHIQLCLPQFATRKGGFPLPLGGTEEQRNLAYLKNLAANIIDYADTDPLPTTDREPADYMREPTNTNYPTYRGVDAYPLVSEQWQRYRFENNGGSLPRYSITHYVELWNMSNQVIEGQVSAHFECKGELTVGFQTEDPEDFGRVVAGKPSELPGLPGNRWHKERPIRLQPNEYTVVEFEPVTYQFSSTVGSVQEIWFRGNDTANADLKSRYRLAFRPGTSGPFTIVDQPLLPVERYERRVRPSDRQRFNTSLPGMSYALRNSNFANNVGDPRAGFYINYHQDVINYENNSSPWARNLRSNIGEANMYRENRIHLWPDGGHNSVARTTGVGSLNRNPNDINLRPAIHAGNNLREQQKLVQRLSGAGRLYSVTELGHVFDPLMWDPNGGGQFNAALYADFANIRTGSQATPVDKYCGGNTLRIGRPEHERFRPDYRSTPAAGRPLTRNTSASALLDIFHCGISNSVVEAEVRGMLERMDGHINLNTASFDTLRALASGRLVTDPRGKLASTEVDPPLDSASRLYPTKSSDGAAMADVIAELIIRNRPFLSPAELAEKLVMPDDPAVMAVPPPDRPDARALGMTAPAVSIEQQKPQPLAAWAAGEPVLGYSRITGSDRVREPEWNDAAAEEVFARIFNNATVRSRNFRITVTGQVVRRTPSGDTQVVATCSRLYHVFIRPVRDPASGIMTQQVPEITYVRNL